MASQFQELAAEVLALQKLWSHENSTSMQRRGILIRDEMPQWLGAAIGNAIVGTPPYLIEMQGRDGTGRKTEVPWVRVFSPEHSPNAREGWYCVLLFHARGDGFYLALSHGSTRWESGTFKPRSNEELGALVAWARSSLAQATSLDGQFSAPVDLGAKGDLGEAYQRGTAASIWYPFSSLPTDEEFIANLLQFLGFLRILYDAESLERSPEYITQQAREVIRITEEIARPSRKRTGGQGYGLSAPERLAVEMRAMKVAEDLLKAQEFSTTDVSRNSSYDFIAKGPSGSEIIVEVKGSTGPGESIILTASEVAAHRGRHPNNALIIVHSISLDRKAAPPLASGGTARVFWSWDISSTELEALSYQCFVPKTDRPDS